MGTGSGKVGWGWVGRWGWRARHDAHIRSCDGDCVCGFVERDIDLEEQMRQSMGDRERVLEGVLERARERRGKVRWGGGLVSQRGIGEGRVVDRKREFVEWENREGR